MNKEASEIVGAIETYLKEAQDTTPEEIGDQITNMLIELSLVSNLFSIEVIPMKESYMLRTRNKYTSDLIGALPSFCRVCGILLGKTPCTHEQ